MRMPSAERDYLTVDVQTLLSFECDLTYLTAPEDDFTLRTNRIIVVASSETLDGLPGRKGISRD